MREKIYNEAAYQQAFAKIQSRKPLINQLINRLDDIETRWTLRHFDTYQVKLTLYGPGGSYDNTNGSILLF